MPTEYLHERKDFPDLLQIIGKEMGILPYLIEKDYWIMHVLHGLQKQGFKFELKGGTSLSKGYGIIDRFSEDIDIHITPPEGYEVKTNPKNTKGAAVESRKLYYDRLAREIQIDGIINIERDTAFDNTNTYNSGGIRLHYHSHTEKIEGVKEGILLEAGFDTVTPNEKLTISSWAYDTASKTDGVIIQDNRAIDVSCYHPGYTFVEKLQTIATKFRQEQEEGKINQNLMRQYYDVYSLLAVQKVQDFIGTDAYHKHKEARFTGKERGLVIAESEALFLSDPELRSQYAQRYKGTATLYYKGQPAFEELLARIKANIHKL
ncbi:MAG: nucleotidyl transferase AbiEii/AbiGii toxin family protein [Chitinophagales bacterium]|nr:nucleotidyl transferase AbiEii/AbiGii toxin family protein [Chitinophagales bacterium]